jgi:hypothetical protein
VITHERLRELVARGARLATGRRVRIVSQLLLGAAIVFVLLRLRSIWEDNSASLDGASWPFLAAAIAFAALAVVAAAFVWLVILRTLGVATQPRWAAIFLQAQLGKYIPGGVWQYAGRAALAKNEEVPVRLVAVSVTAELAGASAAGAVMATLTVGLWLFLTAIVAVPVAYVAFGRTRLRVFFEGRFGDRGVVDAVRATARAAALYIFVWWLLGVSFWFTARALFGVSVADVGFYAGAFAIASLVGLVAFFAPVGLGIREAVIVALLRSRLGTSDALLLAAVSRGVLTVVDLGTAAAGAAVLRRRSPRPRGIVRESIPPVSEHHEADSSPRV